MTRLVIRTIISRACTVMLFLYLPFVLQAQEVGEVEVEDLTSREWNMGIFLNTSGGGISYQQGWTPDYYKKHFYEIDFLFNRSAKMVRGRNLNYPEATTYSYGKMCDLFFLRGGYGYQKVLAHKPYWGGVQIKYTMSAGFSLGIAMPVFLYIAIPDNSGYYTPELQQYDPENPLHDISNIIGRGPYFAGIGKTKLHPGFYGKFGFQFDFATNSRSIQAVEVGVTADMVFPFVQQVAKNNPKPVFLCGYIAYCFGKKKAHYE
ncbi:hypothetical protein LJC53_03335 [Bacteroidales bacterium OttesenSCG-928-C03]|nr:hypothetical protein [Bacteroidales bacterium OttesenSCG-928-C03]